MEDQKPKPIVEEFKGNKVLVLNPGSKFPFSFGVGKAKLILQNIEEIKDFAAKYDRKPEDR